MNSLRVSKNYNIYDIGIIISISLLALGIIGGAFQPIRIMTVCLLPLSISWIIQSKHTKRVQKLLFFFLTWFLYAVISLAWTPDINSGSKEILYYFIHFFTFIQLLTLANYANYPKSAISTGWIMLLVITLPIALFEIITQNHLPMDTFGDQVLSLDGEIIPYRRASVTFGNLNSYVIVLICSAPFLLSKLFKAKKLNRFFLSLVLICLICVILVNASRGGIISLFSIITVYLFFKAFTKNNINFIKVFKILFFIFISIYLIYNYFLLIANNTTFVKLISVFSSGASGLIEDGPRTQIYRAAYKAILDNCLLGSGIGSEVIVLMNNGADIPNSHNLFLELLIQFGIFIFLGFLYILFRIFYSVRSITADYHKLVIYCSFFSFLPLTIINSTYLTMPLFWIYLSSLFIYSDKFIDK